jgi:hypothetical protein
MSDESRPEQEAAAAGRLAPENFHALFGDLHSLLGIPSVKTEESDAEPAEGNG